MKMLFYTIHNGRGGFLAINLGVSCSIVGNTFKAKMFADVEEIDDYIENKLPKTWKEVFDRGSFCIATVIEEL